MTAVEVRYAPLELTPVTLDVAKRFVGLHHRHNLPPVTWRFGVGVSSDSELVGVGMAGNPMARKLMVADPTLIEIIRVTTARHSVPNPPCQVCGDFGTEVHHWAPREVFGPEADNWPTSWLCRVCHEEWHKRIKDHMAGSLF